MFTQFFSLKFNPFVKEIEEKNLFLSNDFNELSSRLDFFKNTRGFFLLTSEPGCGKTTTLRRFAAGLNPSLYRLCYTPLSSVTVMEFYRGLVSMMGDIPMQKKVTMFEQLQRLIQEHYHEKKITPVFIFDEAHCLPSSVLEDIRIIFNFKMDSENPFIVIFAGHQSIRSKLQLGAHQALRQRITGNYHMRGLVREEIDEYITSRLSLAGAGNTKIFNDAAIELVYTQSKGFPRLINNIATAALACACANNKNTIDEETVYLAARDIEI